MSGPFRPWRSATTMPKTIDIPINLKVTFDDERRVIAVVGTPFEIPLLDLPEAPPAKPAIPAAPEPPPSTGGIAEAKEEAILESIAAGARAAVARLGKAERDLFELLRHFENDSLRKHPPGYVDKARIDTIGTGTPLEIGYGFTGKGLRDVTRAGMMAPAVLWRQMTRAEADRFLAAQLIPAYQSLVLQDLPAEVRGDLAPHQLAALASFYFNCGGANFSLLIGHPDTGKTNRLYQGNFDSVRAVLPLYNRSRGIVRNGLVRRRRYELALWDGSGFDDPAPPPLALRYPLD